MNLTSRVNLVDLLLRLHQPNDTCGASSVAAGASFLCCRPRDEPHSVHMAFAVSPDDPNKSFTFSWEDGGKNRHLTVHTNIKVPWERSTSAYEEYANGHYHYHGDDDD